MNNLSEQLVSFYLGHLDEDERRRVEELLLQSRPALMEFFHVKRGFELEMETVAAPDPALKRKIRAEVAQLYARPRFPILAQVAAAAAVLGAIVWAVHYRVGGPEPELQTAIQTTQMNPQTQTETSTETLTDSGAEIALSMNYL